MSVSLKGLFYIQYAFGWFDVLNEHFDFSSPIWEINPSMKNRLLSSDLAKLHYGVMNIFNKDFIFSWHSQKGIILCGLFVKQFLGFLLPLWCLLPSCTKLIINLSKKGVQFLITYKLGKGLCDGILQNHQIMIVFNTIW
jgi:hypothetical protein